jgi:DNA replication and repair protein RecF
VASDAPLVRAGTQQAVIRGIVIRDGRETVIELEINTGRASGRNRARLNRSSVSRPRDVLGTLRTVLFAPEDLGLVKGDPSERRRFLDELLVARQPRWAGVRSDYDKVLRQRNALLKSAAPVLRRGARSTHRLSTPLSTEGVDNGVDATDSVDSVSGALHTLDVWNSHLAKVGAQLLYARLRLMRDLTPYLTRAYDEVSAAESDARIVYRSSLREEMSQAIAQGAVPEMDELHDELLASLEAVRAHEIERGVSLVGPHRDDVVLTLGKLPAKGYASHGESWSFALGLRLAAYQLLRHDLGEDPVLILDDVFAELDSGRRERLAKLIADCEQVLITAAFVGDVPDALSSFGTTYRVTLGQVVRAE